MAAVTGNTQVAAGSSGFTVYKLAAFNGCLIVVAHLDTAAIVGITAQNTAAGEVYIAAGICHIHSAASGSFCGVGEGSTVQNRTADSQFRRSVDHTTAGNAVACSINILTATDGQLTCIGDDTAHFVGNTLAGNDAATHGVNMMYTTLVVPNFARYGKTSFVTGLINSASYVGSAVSTYGVALVSEKFGWNGTMVALLVVSVLGVVFAFFSVPYLKKLKNLNKNY